MIVESYKSIKESVRSSSVKIKILGMTIGLVLLVGLMTTFISRQLLISYMQEDLDRRAVSITNDLAIRTTDLSISNNIYSLYELINQTIRNNPEIEYIFLLDQDMNVVLHTFGNDYKISKNLVEANKILNSDIPNQLKTLDTDAGIIHDVNVPINGGRAGYVRVGLNEKLIEQSLQQLSILMALSILATGTIGVIIVSFLNRIIYRDLNELILLTKQVGKGNMDSKATIYSRDEIGLLAMEFNTMTTRLKLKKEQLNQNLNELEMRNNELLLLNNLLTNSHDIDNLKLNLEITTEKLREVLRLNSCSINFIINNEIISTFNGKKKCKSCVFFQGKSPLLETHYYFPIEVLDKKLGDIHVCFSDAPDESTCTFIESFAKQLSVIVENTNLWLEVKAKEKLSLQLLDRAIKAQEEERKRIARELHDETSQSLTSIIVRLSLIDAMVDSKELSSQIRELKKVTQHTLEEIHYISWSLRPSVLDDLGLVPALKKLVYEYMKKYKIDVDIQVLGFDEIRIPAAVEVTFYRVIQEALTNIARHSRAENVSIILKHHKGSLSIIVEDDGIGFNVQPVIKMESQKHLGLKGMEERIQSIGGRLVIESNPDMGTTIYVKDVELEGWIN